MNKIKIICTYNQRERILNNKCPAPYDCHKLHGIKMNCKECWKHNIEWEITDED